MKVHGPRDPSSLDSATPVGSAATDAAASASPAAASEGAVRRGPAPAAAAASGPYDPRKAVAFVHRYNKELGIPAEAIAAKTRAMKADPHSFYRAMPALFMADVQGPFAAQAKLLPRSSPQVTLAADAHLLNFGTVRGPDGKAVFGMNDFDQTGRGPAEWDLERLATSAVLAARQAGLGADEQAKIVEEIAERYFETIRDVASGADRKGVFIEEKQAKGPVKEFLEKADRQERSDMIKKLTSEKRGAYEFNVENRKPLTPAEDAAVRAGLEQYERRLGPTSGVARPIRILDIAKRNDGGGSSYGLDRFEVLLAPADPSKPPRLLELKQAPPSPVSTQSGDLSRFDANAIIANQRALGGLLNPLAGAVNVGGRSFLAREIEPEKTKATLDRMSADDLEDYAKQAATVLARAQARTPAQAGALVGWIGADEAKIAERLKSFAKSYADQTVASWKKL